MEDEQFNFAIFSLLFNLSYSYMELRHYTEALECLNECLEYFNENSDVYFRRSQARIYNKFSDEDSQLIALLDIQKALKLKNCTIYQEHLEKVNRHIEERKQINSKKING